MAIRIRIRKAYGGTRADAPHFLFFVFCLLFFVGVRHEFGSRSTMRVYEYGIEGKMRMEM